MRVSDVVTIQTADSRARFDPGTGRFDLSLGRFELAGLSAGLETPDRCAAGGEIRWRAEAEGDRLVAAGEIDGLTLRLMFEVARGVTLSAEVTGEGTFALERIVLMQGVGVADVDWVFLDGEPMGAFATADDVVFGPADLMAFTAGGETLMLTFPVRQSHVCSVGGTTTGGAVDFRIECTVGLDDIDGSVAASPLTLAVTSRPHAYLEAHGDRQRTDGMRPIPPAPIAWNSWDYIVNLASADYIRRNMNFIAADPVLASAVDTIVVDDGWMHLYGEWEPNHRFGDGMGAMAREITDAGFTAGIWFAPGIIENTSTMAYWNDHLLARSLGGAPCLAYECMRRYGHALDIRNPEARNWLVDLFKRFREMGYTYFKLDFLKQIVAAPCFGGRRAEKADVVREFVEAIREAVGDACHLMGCNYLYASGPGVVDSARIGGDIAPLFSRVRRNAHHVAARYWMHNRLWVNDPDFAICRGPETSDDPNLDRIRVANIYTPPEQGPLPEPERKLLLPEARTLLSLVILSGGSITLGDNLPVLSDAGLDLLRRTVTAENAPAARPMELFDSPLPETWVQPLAAGWRVGAINFSDEPVRRRVDLADLTGTAPTSAREFWTDRDVPVSDGSVDLELAAHETALLTVE